MHKSFRKEILNHQYEKSDNGLFLPKSKVFLRGIFGHDVLRNGELLGFRSDKNILVNEGLDHILDVVYHNDTQISTWYLGIYRGNYTPQATDTGATISSNSTEAVYTTYYDEAARQAFNEAAASSQSITNSANKATYNINNTVTIYGAFLTSASLTSGDATATLNSAAKFSAQRDLVSGDDFLLTYTISAADDGA